MDDDQKYDMIVIGSGIGSLTFAVIMAKLNGKRVLVLEKYSKAGGLTHEFERKGRFHWDVGLHYVGEMNQGTIIKKIFDFVTEGRIKWNKMPSYFDIFIYPDLIFGVSDNATQYKNDLIRLFPEEKESIDQYFKDVKKINNWVFRHLFKKILPPPLNWILACLNHFDKPEALLKTSDYLNKNFHNIKIKSILTSQWGDYGLPPSQSAFCIHCFIVNHYMKGGYYPEGGSRTIEQSMSPLIEAAGGCVLVNHEVVGIIVENNKAVGVKVISHKAKEIQKKEYYASIIVSGAGVLNTYLKLTPSSVTNSFKDQSTKNLKFPSVVTVYLGLKEDPSILGFKGENYWIFADYDHDHNVKIDALSKSYKPMSCFLSFPSLKNPLAKSYTAAICWFVSADIFNKWENQPWLKRDIDYYQLKENITDDLIDMVDGHFKGFRELIEFRETSTPLTYEHFTSRIKGSIYGMPATPEYFKSKWINARTPIKNLYLTGSDVSTLGIVGAMMGGVVTASVINGPFGFFKFMSAVLFFKSKVSSIVEVQF